MSENPIVFDDWKQYFPFSVPRQEQIAAINFILNSFLRDNKTYVIGEFATGIGKSAIGITVARYLANHAENPLPVEGEEAVGAYVLTTQKILQQQYMDDFGPASGKNLMRSLKSANNYQCTFHNDDTKCSETRRLLTQLGKSMAKTTCYKHCRGGQCPYMSDKEEFLTWPIGITNFSYFLAETMYAKQLKKRSLLIIDECHNVEAELGKFIEVTFSERFARTVLGCRIPKLDTAENVFEWIKTGYKRALQKYISSITKSLAAHYGSNGSTNISDLSKRYEQLDKHMCKVNRFIEAYNPENWVMNPVKTPMGERAGRKFEFKPVDVSPYGFEHLYQYGSRILLMSATVVDKDTFCKSVGIDVVLASFLHLASPFPVENRPIHFLNVGSMSRDNIDASLPKLAQVVKELLELHSNEKGLIHTVNYRIARYIVDAVKSPRLLLHDSTNREATIEAHTNSSEPTVLISPSMTEGVDLADDISRFQILCKVPFPYLGDKVIQMRKQRNKNWYACATALAVIQALGRSVRNENDHATSYILDADWERFYNGNKLMFPSEFSKAFV